MTGIPNNKSEAVRVFGNIWLRRQLLSKHPDGSIRVNVCLETESGDLAAMEVLSLSTAGIYSAGDKVIGTIDSDELTQYLKKYQNTPDAVMPETRVISQENAALFEQVRASYAETKSIKKTAKTLDLSEEKTRRILFTLGDYTCETHEKVIELLKKGVSLNEISTSVGVSRGKIRAYLPY